MFFARRRHNGHEMDLYNNSARHSLLEDEMSKRAISGTKRLRAHKANSTTDPYVTDLLQKVDCFDPLIFQLLI